VTFDGSQTYQTIDGFGANINHRSWNGSDLTPVIDALVDQAGMTLFRVIYDKTDWEATNENSSPYVMNWAYYDQIYSSAEFQKMWGLMGYLNQKGISNGLMLNFQGNGPAWLGSPALNTGMEPEWAQMIASLLIYAAKTNNLAFSLVGPDNEMDQTVQGVNMTGTQYTNALHILSQDLDSNGMSGLRFVGPDMAAGGTVYMPQMLGDPVVMSKVAHFGLHSYASDGGGSAGVASYVQSTAYSNVTVWMTEFNVWCPQCDAGVTGTNTWSYASGAVAYLCAHLANGVSGGLVWEGYDSQYNYYNPLEWSFWGLFAVDDTNAVNKTYTARKIFYTLSQITKWVRPGAQRIGVTGSTSSFSPLMAFHHPVSGQVTIVGINTAGNSVLNGTLSALAPVQSFDLYYTSATTNLAYAGPVPVTNASFSAAVPGDCVFTLVSSGVTNPLVQIDITPADPAILTGGPLQFAATGTYSNGTTGDVTSQAAWSSSISSVATVDAGGLALGVSTGMTTISAAVGPISGSTLLTVQPGPLSIGTNPLPNAIANEAYSASLTAFGGTAPLSWSILSGGLPPGLSLNSNSGAITGTTEATGTFAFTAQVEDSSVPPETATGSFTITVPSTMTIWPSTAVPGLVDGGPDSAVELGVKFRSDVAGNLMGIRFYKASANTGAHVGNLWSSAGKLLASAAFTNESASGWQQVTFASPVAISANTVYVASYHANNGHYSADVNYFATAGVDAPPLHALANGVSGGDGVYAYGASSDFPNQTWESANYWVDVVLRTAPLPTLNSIAVTPPNPTIVAGTTQQFAATGTYSDGSSQNLSGLAVWTSSNTVVATVSGSGLATAASAGVTAISAAVGTVSGSTLLTVQAAPLALTTNSLPTGVVNTAYSTTLTATGGTAPYTWSVTGGALPAGLTLNATNGVISGTPTNTGTFSFSAGVSDSSNPAQTATGALTITIASAPSVVTLWPSTTVPRLVDGGPDSPVELGVKFRSDVAGNLTGIRFYKATANTGTHVGNLWSSSGTLLASATFSNETASGWQQVSFASAVPITSNTIYVASYHAKNGHYSADTNYFLTNGVNSPPLHALTNSVSGGNGVYTYGSASSFPKLTWEACNYWVDVTFQPAVAPPPSGTQESLSGNRVPIAVGAPGSSHTTTPSTSMLAVANTPNVFSVRW
jgi:O-glycosyl hydrolase